MKRPKFKDAKVKAVFDSYPAPLRADLLALRDMIFETAARTEGIGNLIETLKWGQPAYLPAQPKAGSTIRIDVLKGEEPRYAMFFHCQTTLITSFSEIYPDAFTFVGNRALQFTHGDRLPRKALEHCIALALTYHRRSGASSRPLAHK